MDNKLKDLIEKAPLNQEEKTEFIRICGGMGDEEKNGLIKLFQKDLTWIEKLYKNFKLKKDYFIKNGGDGAWRSIVGQEVDAVKKIIEE